MINPFPAAAGGARAEACPARGCARGQGHRGGHLRGRSAGQEKRGFRRVNGSGREPDRSLRRAGRPGARRCAGPRNKLEKAAAVAVCHRRDCGARGVRAAPAPPLHEVVAPGPRCVPGTRPRHWPRGVPSAHRTQRARAGRPVCSVPVRVRGVGGAARVGRCGVLRGVTGRVRGAAGGPCGAPGTTEGAEWGHSGAPQGPRVTSGGRRGQRRRVAQTRRDGDAQDPA